MNHAPILKAVIGWVRDDGDFDVIAAVNLDQFDEPAIALKAILSVIQATQRNGESIIAIERDEIVDVLTGCDDFPLEAAPATSVILQSVVATTGEPTS